MRLDIRQRVLKKRVEILFKPASSYSTEQCHRCRYPDNLEKTRDNAKPVRMIYLVKCAPSAGYKNSKQGRASATEPYPRYRRTATCYYKLDDSKTGK